MKLSLPLLVSMTLWLGGCGSMTTVDDFRPTSEPMYLGEGQKVAILGRRDAGHYVTDRSFIECLVKRMDNSDFLVMPEAVFVDALFPWFEPRTAPKHLKRLKKIMEQPHVRQKVKEEQISYLVWLDGEVESQGVTGAMHCGIGPTGAGCFGFTSWDKTVTFEAIVWDISTGQKTQQFAARRVTDDETSESIWTPQVRFTDDSRRLLVESHHGRGLHVMSVETGQRLWSFFLLGDGQAVSLSANGTVKSNSPSLFRYRRSGTNTLVAP